MNNECALLEKRCIIMLIMQVMSLDPEINVTYGLLRFCHQDVH